MLITTIGGHMKAEKLYSEECESARKDSIWQMLEFLKEW